MMGSRSNQPSGADALAGLLALVNDPQAAALRLDELKALKEQMTAADAARADLREAEKADAARKTALDAREKNLADREAKIAVQLAEIEAGLTAVEQAKADLADREEGFVARDHARDAKVAAERRQIKADLETLAGENAALEKRRAEIQRVAEVVQSDRASVDVALGLIHADQQRLARKWAALSAILNGDE